MSIILKGIDMPKDIDELRLIINGMSIAIEPTQAIQIPTPHGRLIDADKLADDLQADGEEFGEELKLNCASWLQSNANATILEAEE